MFYVDVKNPQVGNTQKREHKLTTIKCSHNNTAST
jgi:hypothetical protein